MLLNLLVSSLLLISACFIAEKPVIVKFSTATSNTVIQPAIDSTMLLNPGKGWVQSGSADNTYTKDYISIGYTRWSWSDIEPKDGQYNWKKIDSFISDMAKLGKKCAFGVINFNGGMGNQYSIPKWVFDAGAKSLEVPDSSTPTGTIILPKTWDDKVYLTKMKKFITDFGAHYNGNPNIAFIDIRDYGNSGECNGEYYDAKNTSLKSLQINYFLPYVIAFPNTQLIVPFNGARFEGKLADPVYAWAVSQGVGLRRDGICSKWSKDGSECLLAYEHEPVIFEYAYGWIETVKDGYSSPETLMNYVNAGRPSYIQFQPKFYESNKEFCHMLGNKMGYHFVLQQLKIPSIIRTDKLFRIQWQWLNDGVAPLYEPCQVAIALLDDKDQVVQKQWLTESNPKTWKPDASTTESLTAKFKSVPAGNYKLAIGLFLDQKDAKPAYRLGIQGRTPDGWYVLKE